MRSRTAAASCRLSATPSSSLVKCLAPSAMTTKISGEKDEHIHGPQSLLTKRPMKDIREQHRGKRTRGEIPLQHVIGRPACLARGGRQAEGQDEKQSADGEPPMEWAARHGGAKSSQAARRPGEQANQKRARQHESERTNGANFQDVPFENQHEQRIAQRRQIVTNDMLKELTVRLEFQNDEDRRAAGDQTAKLFQRVPGARHDRDDAAREQARNRYGFRIERQSKQTAAPYRSESRCRPSTYRYTPANSKNSASRSTRM